MVRFCPKCGALLMPTKNGPDALLSCHKCGYTEEDNSTQKTYILQESIKHTPRDRIILIENDAKAATTMPTARVDCPKCHHKVAEYWQVQTRAADEGSTIFFRCLKCKHTWREY
nr:transcription factor S [Candidatus Njordarchaeota archaeon]